MFRISTDRIETIAEELENLQNKILEIENSLGEEVSGYAGSELWLVRRHINAVKESVRNNALSVGAVSGALQSISLLYEKVENQIAGTGVSGGDEKREAEEQLRKLLAEIADRIPFIYNGLIPGCCFVGDPVNMATGNFIFQTEGLRLGGLYPYRFRCFYNSVGKTPGVFGPGWTGTHEKYLDFADTEVLFHDAGGEFIPFERREDVFRAVGRAGCFLTEEGTGYVVRKGNARFIFDAGGKILREEDLFGNGVSYLYDGRLAGIRSDSGASLSIFYDENGRIAHVTGSDGESALFSYEREYLSKVEIAGSTAAFEYDSEGYLSVIRDESCETVRNQYDAEGRVTEQTMAGQDKMSYRHEGRFLVYTRPNGSRVIYERDDAYRIVSVKTTLGTETYTYNQRNQRISRTDRLGNIHRFRYDDRGNLTGYIDPRGSRTSYTYDADDHLVSVRQANGGRLRFRYQSGALAEFTGAMGQKTVIENNDQGLPVKIIYPDGGEENRTYDVSGNLIRLERSGQGIEEYTYDEKSRLTAVLKNGEVTSYQYNAKGKTQTITRPDGAVRRFSYTSDDKVSCVSDFDGSTRSWAYDCRGRVISLEDACGNRTKYAYDASGHIIRKMYPNGAVSEYIYDEEGRNTEVTGNGACACRYEYDAANRMTAVTAADGARTEYTYDPCGNIVEVKLPDGSSRKYYYDELGNVTRESGPGGREKYFEYDLSGRLVRETDDLGISYENVYDDMDRLIRRSAAGRNTVTYEYYPGGALKKRTDTAGGSEECFYDDCGRLSAKRFNDNYTLTYLTDKLGRVAAVSDSLGASKKAEYDRAGRITAYMDANGNRTKYTYTKDGRIAEIEDAYGSRLAYQYDVMGSVTKIRRTPFGNESEAECTQYIRNARGQVVETIDPMGGRTVLTYDAGGKMKSRKNRLNEVTDFAYDALGNCTSMQFSGGQGFRYRYDEDGALVGFSDANGDVRIRRDVFGNPGEIIDYDGKNMRLTWQHGLKTGETYYNGLEVFYDYDQCGRLLNTRCGAQAVMRQYDPYGRLSEKNSTDGSFERFFYDPAGRLTELQIGAGTKVFKKITYAYDLCGNKTQVNTLYPEDPEKDIRRSYTYDRLNRMREVFENGRSVREYVYDGLGNRKSIKTPDGRTEYTYDAASRLSRETQYIGESFISEDIRYSYDAEGRLVGKSSEKGSSSYSYNVLGRLAEEMNGSGRIVRSYSALGKLVAEHSENANIRYRVDHTELDNRILERESADGSEQYIWNETLTALLSGDGQSSVYTDDLGSVVNLFDGGSAPAMDAVYDEFGKMAAGFGPMPAVGYAGMISLHDSEFRSGFERAYDGSTGRFISEDPVRGRTKSVQNENPYIYCFNKPLTLVDQDAAFPSLSGIKRQLSDMGDDLWNGIQNGLSWTGDRIHEAYENGREAFRTITTEIRQIPGRIRQGINRIRDDHYDRNRYNELPDISEIYTIDDSGNIQGINGWEKQPDSANVYHRNTNGEQGSEAKYNVKFTHKNPDGSSYEVVICFPDKKTKEPYIVTDPYNAGTYNYSNPDGIGGSIGHFIYDMIPYWIWGNQEEDSSPQEFWNRVLGPELAPKIYRKIREIIGMPYTFLNYDWGEVICIWNW